MLVMSEKMLLNLDHSNLNADTMLDNFLESSRELERQFFRAIEERNANNIDDQYFTHAAQGIFLGLCNRYESALEKFFIHYVSGQPDRLGCYHECPLERYGPGINRMMLRGKKYLSISTPEGLNEVVTWFLPGADPPDAGARRIANRFLQMRDQSDDYAHVIRIRNRICHGSAAAEEEFRRSVLHFVPQGHETISTPAALLSHRRRVRNRNRLVFLDMRETIDTRIMTLAGV